MRIGLRAFEPKNTKVGQKGRGLRNVTYFYNFGTPSISLEWVQLETSNLVCGLTASLQTKNAKVGQKGRGLRHMTYFLNVATPSIFLEWVQLETSNLVCRLTAVPKNEEMQKYVERD